MSDFHLPELNKIDIRRQSQIWLADWQNQRQLRRLAREVADHTPDPGDQRPVVFFRASTGLLHMSQNTAFPLLVSWATRLAGTPVVHFSCQAGMSLCVQGTRRDRPLTKPPCRACVVHSRRLFAGASVQPFTYQPDTQLAQALHDLDVGALSEYVYHDLPLGRMVLPALRWILRRHHLDDDAATRQFLREYILSAYKVFQEFTSLVEKTNPQAVVVFNGMFFPEAVVRWVALCRGIRVLTHEVGFRPFSVFFTDGEATAYPIVIPESFTLSPRQNERLEAYLSQRFKGNFSMAGIRFWPEMRGLDEKILERISQHKQVVPVFTNVIFDTSQVHANTVFPHMFAWLEEVLGIIRAHPETLFVIRAHPDEMRTTKASRESVRDWVISHQVDLEPNVIFIDSNEFISSYDLILRSKFVMIYNSSIGLEAAILGTPVLCGGKARFTQYPIVFFPSSPQAYRQLTEQFLGAKKIDLPVEFQLNARRFLYYHLYKVSLPFDDFLASDARPGFVRLKEFSWQQLLPQQSQVLQIIYAGITEGKPFVMEG